jgi:hypothetical protein
MKSGLKIIFKTAVVCFLISNYLEVNAQKKFSSDKGELSFTSNAKLELINATSKRVLGILDPSNGQFAFIVKVKSFEGFNSGLQQQHFNDKYMESDKFYDATYSGKILDPIDYTKDGTYDVRAKGSLVVHGKKQERTIPGKIQIEKGVLTITSDFQVALADHDIPIPEIVSQKIATVIMVKLNVLMTQK